MKKILVIIIFASCASSKIINFASIATEDGMTGNNRIKEYLPKMSKVDQEVYLVKFRESLLKNYCTFARGKKIGLERGDYDPKCPLNSNFLTGYDVGIDTWFAKKCTKIQGEKDGLLNKYPLDCPPKYAVIYAPAYARGKEENRKWVKENCTYEKGYNQGLVKEIDNNYMCSRVTRFMDGFSNAKLYLSNMQRIEFGNQSCNFQNGFQSGLNGNYQLQTICQYEYSDFNVGFNKGLKERLKTDRANALKIVKETL